MFELIKNLFRAFNLFMQNTREAELRADGARKSELEKRDIQDEISKDAARHRKINNSDSDTDVLKRL